nr:TetR/AcrR family transcriptional regulator [Gordonia araii]
MDLFWTRGYAATTPAQLVDHLGIGRGSLYNAFHSKHELYELALERYRETSGTALLAALEQPGTARERIRRALDLVIDESANDGGRRGCMITNAAIERAAQDPAVRKIVRAVLSQQEDAFASVIREGIAAGEIDDVDPAATALLLVTTLNGIRVLARTDPDPRRLRVLADAAMRGL